jgi:hypothetical protein
MLIIVYRFFTAPTVFSRIFTVLGLVVWPSRVRSCNEILIFVVFAVMFVP